MLFSRLLNIVTNVCAKYFLNHPLSENYLSVLHTFPYWMATTIIRLAYKRSIGVQTCKQSRLSRHNIVLTEDAPRRRTSTLFVTSFCAVALTRITYLQWHHVLCSVFSLGVLCVKYQYKYKKSYDTDDDASYANEHGYLSPHPGALVVRRRHHPRHDGEYNRHESCKTNKQC